MKSALSLPATLANKTHSAAPAQSRGFTLVELMVALTGGLVLSIAVLALSRDAGRFYQREMRVANATLSGIVGFERLIGDLARAGFLTTPNIRNNNLVGGDPNIDQTAKAISPATLPSRLGKAAAIQIVQRGSPSNPTLNSAGNGFIQPDQVILSGAFSTTDEFPVVAATATQVMLNPTSPAMVRAGYPSASLARQNALLSDIFGTSRAIRIVNSTSGTYRFATIASVTGGPTPSITLGINPTLPVSATGASYTVNPVNFIQYDVRSLAADPNYAAMYAASAGAPYEADRTELVRMERDVNDGVIAGTTELVAEYAVDLQFSFTALSNIVATGVTTTPTAQYYPPTDASAFANFAGDVAAGVANPQRIRAVRVRFSVRSREADRDAAVVASTNVAAGLYRVGLGPSGAAPFARVRTFQSTVMLQNLGSPQW